MNDDTESLEIVAGIFLTDMCRHVLARTIVDSEEDNSILHRGRSDSTCIQNFPEDKRGGGGLTFWERTKIGNRKSRLVL